MPANPFKEILELCRYLDKTAAKIYQSISGQTTDKAQKAFWEDIAQDEARHVAYWEQLLVLARKGRLNNIFDRPDATKAELEASKSTVDGMMERANDFSDGSLAILLAFRLEYLMLNPSFAVLFHALKDEEGDHLPGVDYREHMDKFLQFVRTFYPEKTELEFIGQILSNVWRHNLDLANQFVQIKTLRGLIPICASCKKIRNDEGFWYQIEAYLEAHSDAQFTHGLCPDCIKKLYPEYHEMKKRK